MMAPQLLSDRVHFVGNVFCMPITLLINFALFQYLVGMFFRRRKEPRTFLLLGCAFVGFAVIIPFSHPDKDVYEHLDRVSEICSTMTFLIQITIIGRDINKKMRIKSLLWMTYTSELLTLVGIALAFAEFIEAVVPGVDLAIIDTFATAMEDISLAFIFVFRFYYIAMSKGFKALVQFRKLEMFLYMLFVTHEYPFMALHSWTEADWEPVQAMWNRFTLLLCILHTISEKIRSVHSRRGNSTKSHGPTLHGNATLSMASSKDASSVAPSRGPSALMLKANSTRQALRIRIPTWRSGQFNSVKPEPTQSPGSSTKRLKR